MYKSKELKGRVRALRLSGQSVREIAKNLSLSKSTVARWTEDIDLAESGINRLLNEGQLGLFRKSWSQKRAALDGPKTAFLTEEIDWVGKIKITKELTKVFCALLYLTQGTKTTNYLSFTESDPKVVKLFLKLLRRGFSPREKKFRCLVYLNAGQSEAAARKFWSELSGIGLGQFNRSFVRSYTIGREGRFGNFRVNYYDVKLVREIRAISTTFIGNVV